MSGRSGVSVRRLVPGSPSVISQFAHAFEEEPWPDNPLLAEGLLRFSRFRRLLEE